MYINVSINELEFQTFSVKVEKNFSTNKGMYIRLICTKTKDLFIYYYINNKKVKRCC